MEDKYIKLIIENFVREYGYNIEEFCGIDGMKSLWGASKVKGEEEIALAFITKDDMEDFYIYEDLVQQKNVVSLLVDGREKGAQLGQVSISPYYIAKKARLECVF